MPDRPARKPPALCVPAGDVRRFMAQNATTEGEDWSIAEGGDGDYDVTSSAQIYRLLERAEFRPRPECESDREWKQVIPYVAITTPLSVFRYVRGKAGDEGRLHDLYSIGVGGHVEPQDIGPRGITRRGIEAALMRELWEEVMLLSPPRITLRGVVDFDGDDVGKVHVGLAYDCRAAHPDLDVREGGALVGGRFVAFEDAARELDRYEPWSRLVLDYLLDV